jgi:hypothetical protein
MAAILPEEYEVAGEPVNKNGLKKLYIKSRIARNLPQ